MYLYGKNSVLERLKFDPASIKKIYLQDNFDDPRVLKAVEPTGIPLEVVSEKRLARIKRAERVQGIVAEASAFKYAPIGTLLQEKKRSFIFLDNINDPHNLGSIMRTAACFGGFAVVIPERSSCEVNETVVHVASGGENYVPVSRVSNLANALLKAKESGYWIVGTAAEGGEDINKASLPFPLCLVLGSEGKGMRHVVEKRLDLTVTLPMKGAPLSFNVAMAAAIFCHEIARQRQEGRA